ncbi:MAG TPA: PucR family transcriptional regulator, partial [Mycobacteriales bacterium]|nr:PucR family transcriptional regulator [Mycobacteriales bacterium]
MPSRDAPLYGRVEKQIARLAHVMLDRFVAEIPIYAMLPREQIEGEILAITDRNLRLFFSALHTGRSLTEEELAEIRISAARRAEERVPLDAVLAAYHVGGRIGWEALVENAKPSESEALVIAAGRVLAYVQQVTGAVAAAYLEERQTIYGEERDALRSLALALLSGEPADAIASRIGIELAATYVVLALQLAEHADEADRGVGGAVAARRKVRRVQQRLDSWADTTVLSLLESRG